MASYDACYYMLSHYIIYICYCIIISYYIIVIIIIFIYIQTNHGNDDMNLCKSYFINDIVTHFLKFYSEPIFKSKQLFLIVYQTFYL